MLLPFLHIYNTIVMSGFCGNYFPFLICIWCVHIAFVFIIFCFSSWHKHKYIYMYIYAAAKSLQSCPTLCDPIDGSPWGSPVPGIRQARTLEWVAISFSNAWKWKGKVKSLSRVRLFVTPWTAAYQAPLSMGFPRQEYCSGLLFPSPGDLPNTGIKPASPALASVFFTTEPALLCPFKYSRNHISASLK